MSNAAARRAPAPPTQQQIAALSKVREDALAFAGTLSSAEEITNAFRWAEQNGHLISPATAAPQLPPGCSVALSVVFLNIETDTHDVGGGKRGLLKHAITKIGLAAGVAFDPLSSGRIDDGSDPRYVHWKAVGAWRHLDGSVLPLVGDKRMDLRDGSDQIERIYSNSKEGKDPEKTIIDMRSFIAEHAQTKAELRAIRKGLGLRSYKADELAKPFLVAKLVFDGHSDDPAERRMNAAAIRAQMLGGSRALFGGPAPELTTTPVHALPAVTSEPPARRLAAPPPVGSVNDPDDDEAIDAQGTPAPGSGPKLPPAQTPPPGASRAPTQPAARPQSQSRASAPASGPVVKFGKAKGEPLSKIDDERLQWYADTLKKSLEDPDKQRFRAQNEKDWNDACDEMERRSGDDDDDDDASPSDDVPSDPNGGY